MAYFIFLKYLRSLEEFRKNPHVKIPPKSSCANFQSLGIFKNQILFRKEFFRRFWPIRPFGPATAHLRFFSTGLFLSPSPLGLSLSAGPAGLHISGAPHGCRLPHGEAPPAAPLHPSPHLTNEWAPPVIPHLRLRPSSATQPTPPAA
jgi:hypothetical protein